MFSVAHSVHHTNSHAHIQAEQQDMALHTHTYTLTNIDPCMHGHIQPLKVSLYGDVVGGWMGWWVVGGVGAACLRCMANPWS